MDSNNLFKLVPKYHTIISVKSTLRKLTPLLVVYNVVICGGGSQRKVKVKVKYEGVLYNTASKWTLPSPVTAPLVLHRQ